MVTKIIKTNFSKPLCQKHCFIRPSAEATIARQMRRDRYGTPRYTVRQAGGPLSSRHYCQNWRRERKGTWSRRNVVINEIWSRAVCYILIIKVKIWVLWIHIRFAIDGCVTKVHIVCITLYKRLHELFF